MELSPAVEIGISEKKNKSIFEVVFCIVPTHSYNISIIAYTRI